MFCFYSTSCTYVTYFSIKEMASWRHSWTVYGWRMAARWRIMLTRSFSTGIIGELTPRPLAHYSLCFLNLPLSVHVSNSTSSNSYFSVASLIIFGKVLRGRDFLGYVWDKYLALRHSAAKLRALIYCCLFPMAFVSVDPVFHSPPHPPQVQRLLHMCSKPFVK
jgi:hypothetical protein